MNSFMFLRVIDAITRLFHEIKTMIDTSLKQTLINEYNIKWKTFFLLI